MLGDIYNISQTKSQYPEYVKNVPKNQFKKKQKQQRISRKMGK